MRSRRKQLSQQACPLSNPKIDIIPENDHLVGVCFCEYCKCGKHICTKNRHRTSQYLSDSFSTSYSRQYQRMKFDTPYIVHPTPYQPNTQKMDFVTTNSAHFPAYPAKPVERRKPASQIRSKTSLFSTTAYNYHYPNWGKQEINYEKGWHAPVRSTEIPFRGETSYSRQFLKLDLKKAKDLDPKKFTACQTKISISPKAEFNPRTTYNELMVDYSKNKMNTHVRIEVPKPVFTPSTPNQYITSMDRSYKPSTASYIDPRKMKLRLMSRGSVS
jgi:hypothetical protein